MGVSDFENRHATIMFTAGEPGRDMVVDEEVPDDNPFCETTMFGIDRSNSAIIEVTLEERLPLRIS